jgi:hypothetical protein
LRLTDHTSESTEVVNRRTSREAVHSTQATAGAALTLTVGTTARNNRRNGSCRCSPRCCRSATSLDGDGSRGSGGGGVDALDGAVLERGAVRFDGELFELRHCLVARKGGVDAEDHAFAAVFADGLFAVHPFGTISTCSHSPQHPPVEW